MKNVTFYIIGNNDMQDDMNAIEKLACDITAEYWRNEKNILISCEDMQQALRIDEALWIRPKRSFIPHNLMGEGLKKGSPVEIDWLKKRNTGTYDILVNLNIKFSSFITTFTEVIDFVPYQNLLKKLARERYKEFRIAGFNVHVAIWK